MVSRANMDAFLRRLRPQTAGGLWLEHVGTIASVRVNATGKRFAGALPRVVGRPLRTPSHFDYWYAYFRHRILHLQFGGVHYHLLRRLHSDRSRVQPWRFRHPNGVYRQLVRAHRAKAIAMSQIGFSVGGLCVPFVMMGLEAFGWRSMALYSGFLILIVGLPLVSLVRHRPEDYGEEPDGIRTKAGDMNDETVPESVAGRANQISLTWRQAVREPSFWLISTGHALSLLTVSSMLAHLIPYLTFDLDYSPVNAGFVFALMTAIQMGGLFLGGIIGDRFDKRMICTLCMLGHFVGLMALSFGAEPALVFLFAIAHGLAWGVRAPRW